MTKQEIQERLAQLEQQRRLDEQRLCALLQALPPLGGDLTDSEIAIMRMLRAMSDRTFGAAASFIEEMLLRDAQRGELVQPLRARLELVYSSRPSRRSSE